MAKSRVIRVANGASAAFQFEFKDPADGLELALRILRQIYDALPNDLPIEERLKLHELLIDGTYLRLILFLGSDYDKVEVEGEFSILDSDDLLDEPTEGDDLPAPSPF